MATSDPDPRIGHVVDGRYRILERLAQGGMGVVYRAERIPVGKTVAVKFLHRIYADDQPSLARFERETRVLSKLAHPNCVSVIDFGVDGSPYLVMDFAGGITLRAALDEAKMRLTDSIAIIRQVLAGLAHAHTHGIVHRDIKPANIMISDEIGTGRHVRLLDFGLARLATSSNLTQSSVAIGTPSYMAPEQTVGGEVDVRTDIYQVGVVLFEMVTGERLFVAEDTSALLEMHRSARVPRIAEVAPGAETKPGLDDVLQSALAKAPSDRWQSAMGLSSALDEVVSGRWRKPRSSGRLRSAVVVAMLGGLGYAGVTYWQRHAISLGSRDAGESGDSRSADSSSAEEGRPDAGNLVGSASVTTPHVDPTARPPDAAIADAASGTDDASLGAVKGTDAGGVPDARRDAATADAGDLDDVATEEVASADPETSERTQDAPDDRPPPVVTPLPVSIPLAKTLPAVTALLKKGQREVAISSLQAMWKKAPKDGRLPYLLGNVYFDKRWWSAGMQHYHAAIARSPSYKSNPTLIRNVISAIGDARTRGKAIYLLTKVIGSGAKGLVRTASRTHADASVRKTALALLKRW
jgi:eukaryotic-like serine/threonine-protein kinase